MTSQPGPLRVLLVEDEAHHAQQIAQCLTAAGAQVVHEPDGLTALGHLRSQPPPDLVVLDLLLPGVNGWNFYAEMRRNPAFPKVPILVVTSAGLHPPAELANLVGFLRKPSHPSAVPAFEAELRAVLASLRAGTPGAQGGAQSGAEGA
ncbi:response regulator [Aggregicoccus sp. 17bor-14]|uniref:response regulator n=1 Tax=Myxococcaceae TaxID=31 RepID=UPI00129D116B|nr:MULTISPECIES: response regulator [Myxococcaceae]MBF5046555.1 response regulator [Simulacricoccus sp. 17bor-14]MRI92266.1 response regulator [Aggregicoccus sp. 17bor-14]